MNTLAAQEKYSVVLDRLNANARTPAAVIGLDSLQGLQTVRILHGHGVPVIAIAADPGHHACRTNACQEIWYADTGSGALIETLLEIASRLSGKAVLVPCQDKCVRMISRHRERLAGRFEFALPPAETVEMLMDKCAFYKFAMLRGFRVPTTFYLHDRGDAVEVAQKIPFPCMLKPAYRDAVWDRHSRRKVFRIKNAAELLEYYDMSKTWAETLIAQQWIEGGDDCLYSCNFYIGKEGEALVTFVARKLRQWPPEAGSSCLGEEVRDDMVLETTRRIFAGLGYIGLGHLEMKRDAASGEYFIIEPNIGRPTGRSAIAEGGGVALLYTMYCDLLNLPLPSNRTQQYRGIKWIDLLHDIQSAFWYWRQGRLPLRSWIRSLSGPKTHAVLSWRDPKPFLAEVRRAAAMYFARPRVARNSLP